MGGETGSRLGREGGKKGGFDKAETQSTEKFIKHVVQVDFCLLLLVCVRC